MKWKPTPQEMRWIRRAAEISAGRARVRIEPGTRFNINGDSRVSHMNIALLSDDPDWNDTDLSETVPWAWFRKGVELTSDGRAIVDFYVYEVTDWGDLRTNVTVYYAAGAVQRIDGTMDGDLLPRVKAA
jgi:hypothetical protein